jgi:hypothetical protein
MHMVSLALWPVAWAIGHTGTISLYNALVSLIAGTSRVPEIVSVLQWSTITGTGTSAAQVQATYTALGNWFMGNLTALLSILVGGVGFVLWVVVVSILGPAFLHKLLTTGALFATQAAGSVGQYAAAAGDKAYNKARNAGTGGAGLFASGPGVGEQVSGRAPVPAHEIVPIDYSGLVGGSLGADASMANAARLLNDSGGKPLMLM